MAGNAVTAQEASSPIRDQVRETGVFERIVVTTYDPMQLADLVAHADLIVEASTRGGRSFLNAAGTDIYTNYTFNVHSLLKSRQYPELRPGTTMTVRREGGDVIVDGHAAVSYENGFPAFNADEHYILFLKQQGRENVYSVFGGPQGAFRAGELVTQLAMSTDNGSPAPQSVPRQTFMGELRALLKFSVN
jgi:hypothetical protein